MIGLDDDDMLGRYLRIEMESAVAFDECEREAIR